MLFVSFKNPGFIWMNIPYLIWMPGLLFNPTKRQILSLHLKFALLMVCKLYCKFRVLNLIVVR